MGFDVDEGLDFSEDNNESSEKDASNKRDASNEHDASIGFNNRKISLTVEYSPLHFVQNIATLDEKGCCWLNLTL